MTRLLQRFYAWLLPIGPIRLTPDRQHDEMAPLLGQIRLFRTYIRPWPEEPT